jgi:peptide/nickel transport system substrate-binding protein/oligopeptide transport system substrate-binding protein
MKRLLALFFFVAVVLGVFLILVLGEKSGPGAAGSTLRIPLNENPKSLDPVRVTDVYSDGVAKRIYNGLVKHSRELKVVGDLAESFEASADGKTYTFKLRKGVKFHHGREMTSDDVVFSLTRLADPRVSRKRELVEEIVGAVEYAEAIKAAEKPEISSPGPPPPILKGLAAPDKYTVTVELKRPFVPFLHQMAMSPASIVPRDEVERLGKDFASRAVGTGPFKLVTYKPNDRIELVRFDDYFGGRARLGAVQYRIIQEPVVRLKAYLNGDLDLSDVPLARLKEMSGRPDHHSWSEIDTFYLGISTLKEPYGKNVHLRRALNFAIDRERLCNVTLQGRGVPAKGILPPGIPGYNPKLVGFSYSPEKVREELKAAGYPGGKGLKEVPLYYRQTSDGKLIAIELQQQLKRANIPVKLEPVDFGHLLELTVKSPPELFSLGWVADYPDPENFLYVLFHSAQRGQSNRVHFSSRKVDQLLDAARAMPAGKARFEAYQRAEEQVVSEAPWVFLYHRTAHLLISPKVRGIEYTPLDTGTELPQTDFTKITKD